MLIDLCCCSLTKRQTDAYSSCAISLFYDTKYIYVIGQLYSVQSAHERSVCMWTSLVSLHWFKSSTFNQEACVCDPRKTIISNKKETRAPERTRRAVVREWEETSLDCLFLPASPRPGTVHRGSGIWVIPPGIRTSTSCPSSHFTLLHPWNSARPMY